MVTLVTTAFGFRHVFHPTGCHELLHELSVFFFSMVSDAEASASLCWSFWICIFERHRNSWPDVCTLFFSLWIFVFFFGAKVCCDFPDIALQSRENVTILLLSLSLHFSQWLYLSSFMYTFSVGFVRTAWGQGEPLFSYIMIFRHQAWD